MEDAGKVVVYLPNGYELSDLTSLSSHQASRMKQILNDKGVDMPEQQAERGELWLAPDKLFARRD